MCPLCLVWIIPAAMFLILLGWYRLHGKSYTWKENTERWEGFLCSLKRKVTRKS